MLLKKSLSLGIPLWVIPRMCPWGNINLKGSSLGYVFQLGYDLGLSDKLSLGFQTSFLAGTLTKFKKEQGAYSETIYLEEGSSESFSRIDFSVGLRFKY